MDFAALSHDQRKLLKKIARDPEIRTDKYNLKDVEYLKKLELVDICSCDKPNDFYYQASISEKGKAFLHGYKFHFVGDIISKIIAILGFILSLLNAFTPFPEWIQAIIIKLFTK